MFLFRKILNIIIAANKWVLNEYFQFSIIHLILILSGDVDLTPGPQVSEYCLSILHSNIHSIRNKTDYIMDHFLDFDILCFTESHLDNNVLTTDIKLL